MTTRSFKLGSLALAFGLLAIGCAEEDGEDIGQTNDELQDEGGVWEDEAEKSSEGAEAKGAVGNLSVDGDVLRNNGKKWVSRGVIFEGFLYTKRDIQECVDKNFDDDNNGRKFCQRHFLSRDYYEGKGTFAGKDALTLAINNWNINTVRFNLNQNALDPGSKGHDPAYIDEIEKVTKMARNRGLAVVLAPFSGRNEGAPDKLVVDFPKYPMPTKATMGAIEVLSRRFGDDGGVAIDLFNEPFGNWKTYLDGGQIGGEYAGVNFVGVNDLLNRMRGLGAKNVAIVQGLGADWSDFPGGIRDAKVAFSGHPFLPTQDQQLTGQHIDWYTKFGEVAKSHPYWITAWDAAARDKWCNKFGIGLATEFVQYTRKKDMGMIGFAFDVPFSMTRDFRDQFDQATQMPTSCVDSASAHAGSLLQASFNGTLPKLNNGKPKGGAVSTNKNKKVGKPIQVVVDAKDPDKDPLSYTLKVDDGPASPRQHADTFQISFDRAGKHRLTVTVADNKGALIRKTVTIQVDKK